MLQLTAQSKDSKVYQLFQEENLLGTLTYPKWYSSNAELQTNAYSNLSFVKESFWDGLLVLKDGETVLLDMKLGWSGLYINTYFSGQEQRYVLNTGSLLNYKFSLQDMEGHDQLSILVKFSFKNFKTFYELQVNEKLISSAERDVLTLAALHGVNYYLRYIVTAAI